MFCIAVRDAEEIKLKECYFETKMALIRAILLINLKIYLDFQKNRIARITSGPT